MSERRLLVAIPVYGQHHHTERVVADLDRQSRPDVDVVVIDNKGDYAASGSERVLTPGENIGWARASNLAFREGFSNGYSHVMTLNNDTRLSPSFLDGLLDERLPSDAGIVAPLYDDQSKDQLSAFTGPADAYVPVERYRRAAFVDGTCLTLTLPAWRAAGGLDERSFGSLSWGADLELCLRVREAGFAVVISELSYLNHLGGRTAAEVVGRVYRAKAFLQLAVGIRRTTGQKEWTRQITVQNTEIFDLVDGRLVEKHAVGKYVPS